MIVMRRAAGRRADSQTGMELYQHDSSSVFRMVLRGSLKGLWVNELEHAWMTATSILKGKDFVIDISGLTGIDISGLQLLSRIRAAGGRLTGEPPT